MTEHRLWRMDKGEWNMSDAKCLNNSCFIGSRNMSVSDYLNYLKASQTPMGSTSIKATRCCKCGSDLTKAPGARYSGGDGIPTYGYNGDWDPDPFITEIRVSDDSLKHEIKDSNLRHGFAVESRVSDAEVWDELFTVDRFETIDPSGVLPPSGIFSWGVYDSNSVLVKTTGEDHPEVFKAHIPDYTKSEVQGKHFMCRRARYVRLRSIPIKRRLYLYGDKDTLKTGPLDGACAFDPAITDPMTNEMWSGGRVDVWGGSWPLASGVPMQTMSITHNDDKTVHFSPKFILPSGVPSGVEHRIYSDFYVSSCGRFEVYGIRFRPDELTMTPRCPEITRVMSYGNHMLKVPSLPSRIEGVSAVMGGVAAFDMTEAVVGDELKWKVEDRTWKDGDVDITYKAVIGGNYTFDAASCCVIIPSICDDDDGTYVFDLNRTLVWNDGPERWFPTQIRIKYWPGRGCTVSMQAEAVSQGTGHIVEKGAISTLIQASQSGVSTAPPDGYDFGDYAVDPGGGEKKAPPAMTTLPECGNSIPVYSSSDRTTKTYPLQWLVENPAMMKCDLSVPRMVGNELPAGQWNEASIKKLYRGKISGRASGKVEVTGKPGVILSGNLFVATDAANGGLADDGFVVKMDMDDNKGSRQGACFNVPQIMVFLKEKTEDKGE
jgi:hypothetical protein